ncbi:hypothetical protein OG462_42030 [Streptomyces sp. NBC_01077]|uniref:hypothetical protein n=1 Tax=Streptomyces sp. NBC_01077 TaxID=2903746 RepID=UPI0038675CC2|nr:hypothetical protein OG462_02990 [Streptomyces sp. NBC_01077]WSV43449.1 hypothetical protein OG462_42030 [Streptomyces sp. NBC_01077]
MTSLSAAVHGIDATTSALQKELPLLEQLQQDLEKELAAVSERVLSVRTALTALLALAETPAPRAVQEAEPAPAESEAAVETSEVVAATQDSGAVPAPRKAAKSRSAGGRKTASSTSGDEGRPSTKEHRATAAAQEAVSAAQESGGLTEQVAAVLSQSPSSPMRARDVAQALGRDSSTSAVNTVRSTLDRLVATSRASRAGRGLYQAPAS